ncbi:gliding motility-associated C-terminal domain-containing protein [Crocinitomicaceae bacterium]|nr:gliding motility-associated C-terminal domain-containing protein [Crocinitomicaceae bacterium]
MIEKDNIQDLLREKLQSHEVTPSDAVWKNVSSSLSSAATSGAAAGSSILFKAAVAVIGVSGLGISTYFVLQEEEASKPTTLSSIQLDQNEKPDTEIESVVVNSNDASEDLNEEETNLVPLEPKVKVASSTEIEEIETPTEESFIAETVNPTPSEINVSTEQNTIPVVNAPANAIVEPVIVEDVVDIEEEFVETIEESEIEEIVEDVEENISLPNIFTPNNDGANDFFTIEMSDKLDFQIVVIDQTNTVVFQSNDKNFRWDGTMMSGEPAPSGNYVYFLSAKTMSGKDFVKSSKLRIQR